MTKVTCGDKPVNRRQFLATAAKGLTLIPLLSIATQSATAAEQLSATSNPVAAALGYVTDAQQADIAKFPKRNGPDGAKQFCSTCIHFKATDAASGTCALFPNYLVAKIGWCNAWIAIP